MNAAQIQKDTKDRMDKALDVLKNELKGLRTGRASPALLDSIRVDYFGSPTPLKQLGNITAPEPTQLLIKPFDLNSLKDIEKAIRSSDLGLAPNNDGKVIRLQIPTMSGEQRTKMAKKIKEVAEHAKVSCRNIRRDANKHFDDGEKAKTMSEDDVKKGKDDIQNLLKLYEGKIDEIASTKTKEVMEQ
ncbi:ribosome recycling factor [Telmatocola sphagniphila]|uniref:Ribosome-recycling factor n=1 Tax=Telmatocola sphagniphila TaxID=1123043 RepID=A0A8E6EX99_9BACT|nr:ribosome recycling factor [Telmatocola sphagniphila]QVL34657.1 ribosome recycling factor [Telmatocola sphagniphila]